MRPSRLTSRSVVRVSAAPVVVLGLAVLLPSAPAATAPQAMEAMVRQAACRIEAVNEQVGETPTDRSADGPTVFFTLTTADRATVVPDEPAVRPAPPDRARRDDGLLLPFSQLALPPPAWFTA